MPDGPRYDDDFYAWTQYQAEVLRSLKTRDNRFDRENLAEEIETVGRNERDAVRSQVRRVLEHQGGRHGDRTCDLPVDPHRTPWNADGRQQSGRRRDVLRHMARAPAQVIS